jgi:hypothetical protein
MFIMRNREAEVQEKINELRERVDQGLRSLPKHDHLKNLRIEYEPIDYQTLVIHFLLASHFTEADIATIKDLLGGSRFCQFTPDTNNKLRLSFTLSLW